MKMTERRENRDGMMKRENDTEVGEEKVGGGGEKKYKDARAEIKAGGRKQQEE